MFIEQFFLFNKEINHFRLKTKQLKPTENENADHKDAEDHRGCDMYSAKQEITIEYGEYDL